MFNRRGFLKNFSLAGAAVAVPVSMVHASPIKEKIDLGEILLSGRVHAKGKGIRGVAVTDGLNVTLTDAQGNYQFKSIRTAEFVYISIPSGYTIPHEKGVAQFYKSISKGSSSFKADFELEKLIHDDNKHAFVVWADPQIKSEKDAELLLMQSAPDLKALVASYPKEIQFHGMGCGDLVWDKFELFDEYRSALNISGIPFFNVIGNHDMDLDARSDEYSSMTFKKQFGPTYYSFNRGAVHYIVLDDVFFVGASKKYIGYITEQQLSWLEQDLAQVKQGSTVVLSVHIPTNTGAARRNNKEEELGGTVANREQLYKLLKPFNTHVMSGHTHVSEHWEREGLMEHVHGTVCGAWWTGPICSDGTPNGYGVYEVDGNEITWYYKSTGKPREHQLRIYPVNSLTDAQSELVVNVWNWDPKWKVEFFEDGVSKGEMKQRTGLDPWAIQLFAGPELPKKHKFVEPTKTDHLFFAKVTEGVKVVKVKVTDRFGKEYSETLNLQTVNNNN